MRPYALIAVFALLPAVALNAAPPAASQPSGPLAEVLSELRKIQPPMYETAAVETALVEKGKAALPALRDARKLGGKLVGDDELQTNRYAMPNGQGTTVDMSPREDRVRQLADIRLAAVERALTRIDFGFNPAETVAKWAAAKKDATPLPSPQPLNAAVLSETFPDVAWCHTFKGYSPVMRMDEAESSWAARNLFAVDRKLNVTHIASPKDLEGFFRMNLSPVKAEANAKSAVQAWLTLSQTLQDHAAFPVEMESLKAAKTDGGWTAEGRAASGMGPRPGAKNFNDAGFAAVKLTFDADGKLLSAVEDIKFRPGMRPICQSSKLLDSDPLVRAMAETELRLMGRSAEPYLKARRAVTSPELKAAIDRVWQRILDDERDFGW